MVLVGLFGNFVLVLIYYVLLWFLFEGFGLGKINGDVGEWMKD